MKKKKPKKLNSLEKKILEIKHSVNREDFLKRCLYRHTQMQSLKYDRKKQKREDRKDE